MKTLALILCVGFFSFSAEAKKPQGHGENSRMRKIRPAAPTGEVVFGKGVLTLNSASLHVEVAKTMDQQMRGLMFRRELGENSGMIFVYTKEEPRAFWMKNTFVPLSIGFFDKNRTLIEIVDMTPVTSEMQVDVPTYNSEMPAQYALEVSQGWFKRHGIKPGVKFTLKD